MVENTTVTTSNTTGVSYGISEVDAQSILFQTEMKARYYNAFNLDPRIPDFQAASAAVSAEPTYDLTVDGTLWIITVDLVQLGDYDYSLIMLAIPRVEVYGSIDKAQARARAISIGISAGLAAIVCGVFVLVVLPLSALVQQMRELTNFNFATLESS
ncbi:hypothetical protein HKX48_009223, partial [Thoreauomyces humboldtii]